ncbi:hypothetical protein FALCPG4_011619 [Fusarium falciforme]
MPSEYPVVVKSNYHRLTFPSHRDMSDAIRPAQLHRQLSPVKLDRRSSRSLMRVLIVSASLARKRSSQTQQTNHFEKQSRNSREATSCKRSASAQKPQLAARLLENPLREVAIRVLKPSEEV